MAGISKTSINVSHLPKDKISTGKKGKYLPNTISVNDEPDQFGNQGPVVVDQTKEEREAKAQKTYLGNCKVVWTNGTFPEPNKDGFTKQAAQAPAPVKEEDLPF